MSSNGTSGSFRGIHIDEDRAALFLRQLAMARADHGFPIFSDT
jgi:hypothetical protein